MKDLGCDLLNRYAIRHGSSGDFYADSSHNGSIHFRLPGKSPGRLPYGDAGAGERVEGRSRQQKAALGTPKAVSYTHLDVYKRQEPHGGDYYIPKIEVTR